MRRMAGSQSALLMAQRLTNGRLAVVMASYRRAGASWPTIANLLREEFGVEASADQLRMWAKQLNVDALEAAPEPTEATG